jgi:hypothetical protein
MIKESQAREMAKDQRYAAMMNVAFVLDNVVPRISSQLNVSMTIRRPCDYKIETDWFVNSDTLTDLYLSLIP